MTKGSSKLIRPLSQREGEWSLNAVDYLWTSVPNVSFVLRFPTTLNVAVLETALAKSLDKFPILASRLEKHSKSPLCFVLKDSDSYGCMFQVETSVKVSYNRHQTEGNNNQVDYCFYDERFFPSNQAPFLFPHEPLMDFGPLLCVKVSHLCNGETILGLSFVHAAGDGASLCQFLRYWSSLCGKGESVMEGVLQHTAILSPRVDRRLKVQAAKVREAGKRGVQELHNTMGQFLQVLAKVVPTFFLDKVCDVLVEKEQLVRVKEELSASLGNGRWVSTYEVLSAILMRALFLSHLQESGKAPEEIVARFVVDIRKRGESCGETFFGNGVTVHSVKLDKETLQSEDWLNKVCVQIHTELREALANPDTMDSIVYLSEAGLSEGHFSTYLNRLRWTKLYSDNVMCSGTTLINSWTAFDWWSLDFGTLACAQNMYVSKRWSQRNYFLIFPFDAQDKEWVIRLQMKPSVLKAYLHALNLLQIPFRTL